MENIKIEVYGGTNSGGGGCSCGCSGCTPADAKAEYEAMKKELVDRFGETALSLEFIDTAGVNLAAYPEVERVIQAGYSFPITVINGSPRLAGGMPVDSIIQIVTDLQPEA